FIRSRRLLCARLHHAVSSTTPRRSSGFDDRPLPAARASSELGTAAMRTGRRGAAPLGPYPAAAYDEVSRGDPGGTRTESFGGFESSNYLAPRGGNRANPARGGLVGDGRHV